jgi:hypothetical protein
MDRESLYLLVSISEGLVLIPLMYFSMGWFGRWFGPKFSTGGPTLIVMIALVIQIKFVVPMFR